MRDGFAGYHPAVNMVYFAAVLVFAMFLMHPVCLLISLASSVGYALCLRGEQSGRFKIRYLLPLPVLVMLLNPLFNHRGLTVLCALPSGNPLTLESVLYGAAAGCLMAAVLSWFYCYTAVMTSDKFVYLFGWVIPSMSLVLSMTLRFVPRFRAQFQAVRQAQRCIGRDLSNGRLLQRMRHGVRILSVMASWSMEHAVETADSMKSRGYGLPGRTAFSIYRFQRRDGCLLALILLLTAYIAAGGLLGGLSFDYFPVVGGQVYGVYTVTVYIADLILCLLPAILHIKEAQTWKSSRLRA